MGLSLIPILISLRPRDLAKRFETDQKTHKLKLRPRSLVSSTMLFDSSQESDAHGSSVIFDAWWCIGLDLRRQYVSRFK